MNTFFEMIQKTEEEINDMFNSGMFNSLAIGYSKIALKSMGKTDEEIRKFETEMNYTFSEYDAKEARKAYQKL